MVTRQRASVAEIFLDHVAEVMNGENEAVEAFCFGALDDVFEHRLTGDRQQRLRAILGMRTQSAALTSSHDEDEIRALLRHHQLVP